MSHPVLDETAISILEYVGGAVLAAGVLWLGRGIPRSVKRFNLFLDNWDGSPASPGVNARPGVMERLQNQDVVLAELVSENATVKETLAGVTAETKAAFVAIDKRLAVIQPQVSQIHHETQPNGGDSMKDQLNRLDPLKP